MRHFAFATLCLSVLAACEPDGKINPVTVQWMDWPAEVNAGQPFRTRLVVWGVCALNPRFRAGASADQSAVTFAPYYLIEKDNDILCAGGASELLVVTAIDTAGTAPGLAATFARTYEMRGSSWAAVSAHLPVRTFGNVTVRPSGADLTRRNAAGDVQKETDSLGCVRVRPSGLYNPQAALVLEDQADTAGLSFAFVRGYIYEAATPVCGETKVFHVVARE